MIAQPSYLLFSDIADSRSSASFFGEEPQSGKWKFVLEHLGGPVGDLPERFEASDLERGATPDRLALMAVVRGLEALEQPSRVKLVTTHRYVERGLRYGLPSWREKDYHWERFGAQIPVRNADLWRRVDIALQFHAVDCRYLQTAKQTEATTDAEEFATTVTQVEASSHASSSDSQLVAREGFIEADAIDRTTQQLGPQNGSFGSAATLAVLRASGRSIRYDLFARRRQVATNALSRAARPSVSADVSSRFAGEAQVSVQWIPQSLQSWWHLIGGWIRWMKGRLRSPLRPFSVSQSAGPLSTHSQRPHSALVGV